MPADHYVAIPLANILEGICDTLKKRTTDFNSFLQMVINTCVKLARGLKIASR
jgi:hypothetical protein